MKISTTIIIIMLFLGTLSCSNNKSDKQSDEVLVQDSLTTEHFRALISIQQLSDSSLNRENPALVQTRKGGKSEGDKMYQLVGDLSYIADQLAAYQIRTPGKEVRQSISIDLNFITKEAKENLLSSALDSSFQRILNFYSCEPAGEIQQALLTLSLNDENQFEEMNQNVTDQLIADGFASEGVVDKKTVSKDEIIFYKTDASEILHTLNQTTDTLKYSFASGDPLPDKKLSMQITAPFSEDKINNLFTGYGVAFDHTSENLAIKTCRLDPESSEDLEDVHYLRMLK